MDNIEMLIEKANKQKKRKKRWVLLLILLMVLAAGGVGLYFYFNQSRMDDTTKYWFDKMAQDGTLEGKSAEELQSILNSIVEEGMFNVSINVRPVFESGDQPGSLGIENIEENHFYCTVTLIEDETQEVLYKSQGIKPGQYVDEVTLEKDLEQGTYNCTAQFVATDPESLDEVGQVNVVVVLTILN